MATLLLTVGLLVGAAAGFAGGWWVAQRRQDPGAGPGIEPVAPPTSPAVEALERHPVGVVIADGSGRITFRSAAALRLQGTHVGVLVDEAIERHLTVALSGEVADEVLELYGPPRAVLEIEAHPIADGAVVFVEDVSERRRIDRVRTDFVANISHELKTPIGALSVLAEALADERDPETVDRLVDRMMSETDRAARVVDDLMELSRIELGGEPSTQLLAAATIVNAAIERVSELAAQREIGITHLGAAARPGVDDEAMVVGDERQLVSAVRNLVENAVKYSESGSTVQVRTRRDGRFVDIAVVDSGPGIPQRELDRIFERFYRVDRARSRATGGTGLGLSIVRNVALRHGGDVLVTSTEGEGSTFLLRLPAGDHRAASDDPDAAPGHDATPDADVDENEEGIA